jgi:hypothetical protein
MRPESGRDPPGRGDASATRGTKTLAATPPIYTFLATRPGSKLGDVGISISDLRNGRESDQTLENLLTALSLNLELRARYRVFEFEATQEGHPDVARLFADLRRLEQQQIADLLAGLRTRLGEFETQKELA